MSVEEILVSDSPVAVLGVGDRLKAERIARSLSLDDVAQTLKVSLRVLEQVEANAWSELPGRTFARGIVRGYAKFVHLDAEPILKELEDAALPKLPELDLPRSTHAALPVVGATRVRDKLAMVAGVIVIAAAVVAYLFVPDAWLSGKASAVVETVGTTSVLTSNESQTALPSLDVVQPGSAVALSAPISEPLSAPVSNVVPVTLVLRFIETSWVEVKDVQGVMLLSENVLAGNERSLSADAPISLALGNAEGVKVTYGGREIDLKPHTKQKVARLSLE